MEKIKKNLFLLLTAILGLFFTFLISQNNYFPYAINAVCASSIVGLSGGLLLPAQYARINYCASFAGMSSQHILTPLHSLFCGIILFVVWLIFEDWFIGVGGKSGTIAMIATLILSSLLYFIAQNYSFPIIQLSAWNELTFPFVIWIIVFSVLGVVLTFLFRRYVHDDPVIASATIGLIGGIAVPYIPLHGVTFSLVLFAGTFAGMSSISYMKNFRQALFLGIIVGFMYMIFYAFIPGVGGKLGFVSFCAVLFCAWIKSWVGCNVPK